MKIKVSKGSISIEYVSKDEVGNRSYNPAVYTGKDDPSFQLNNTLLATIKAMATEVIRIDLAERPDD